jgi:hypothetical protein
MSELVERLPMESIVGLRRFGEAGEDVHWPATLAARRGWRVANAAYQEEQRAHGHAEMDALLAAAGLEPPLPPAQAADVLLAAAEIFLGTPGIDGEACLEHGQVRVDVSRCPLFDHFTDRSWQGLTACGCFARVEGWHEALGIAVDRELIFNRKWGDPVCEVVMHLPDAGVPPEATFGEMTCAAT